jgi:orotidine-5'-phosphate decarboxylase
VIDSPVLIVALDTPTLDAALDLVSRIRPVTPWFKIGSILFTAAGPDAVRRVQAEDCRVFLDLKFHDIPQTVAGAVAGAAALGVALVTMHCGAGPAAMREAAEAVRRTGGATRVLGVTRLTSEAGRGRTTAVRAALAAREAGLDGVTAPAHDCARIKAACGPGFRVLTPGIRPAGAAAYDQTQIATPQAAVGAGADYLVVGRPITAAANPVAAAQAVAVEIAAARTARPETSHVIRADRARSRRQS